MRSHRKTSRWRPLVVQSTCRVRLPAENVKLRNPDWLRASYVASPLAVMSGVWTVAPTPPPVTPVWSTVTLGERVSVKLSLWTTVISSPGDRVAPVSASEPARTFPIARCTARGKSRLGLIRTAVPPRQMSMFRKMSVSLQPALTLVRVSGRERPEVVVRVTRYSAPGSQRTVRWSGRSDGLAVQPRCCRRSMPPPAGEVASPHHHVGGPIRPLGGSRPVIRGRTAGPGLCRIVQALRRRHPLVRGAALSARLSRYRPARRSHPRMLRPSRQYAPEPG